jgi:DNA modification methylase
MATECAYKNHSATFPIDLPSWFIKLFTETGDIVLDPFVGSGTTALAAKQLGRHFVGIDALPEYCRISKERVGIVSQTLDALI